MTKGELHALNEVLKFITAHMVDIKASLKRLENRWDRLESYQTTISKLRKRVRVLEELVDIAARRELPDIQPKRGRPKKSSS